jgi:hypothetical protein
MLQIRRSKERGFFDHGWLKTHHTFSFADYRDSRWTVFRSLRVINEDWVSPGEGFPSHSHRDMEILTYVIKGALEHKDSMGNTSVIRPGDVQRMSAGTGVTHSEFNHASLEPVHLLQIWITPNRRSLEPGYEQKTFAPAGKRNVLRLIASGEGAAHEAVRIHQDVRLFDSRLETGNKIYYTPTQGRGIWIQVVTGGLVVNGVQAAAGDGLFTDDADELSLSASETCEFLMFDLGPVA